MVELNKDDMEFLHAVMTEFLIQIINHNGDITEINDLETLTTSNFKRLKDLALILQQKHFDSELTAEDLDLLDED